MTVYQITETEAGWNVAGLGRFPTACEAAAAVRRTERELAEASGRGFSVAKIEWLPSSRVGRSVVRAILDEK